MRHLVQFHDYEQDFLPTETWEPFDRWIFSRQPPIQNEIGSRVFLIAGVGQQQQCFLWTSFIIDKVEESGPDVFRASGKGWDLNPPQRLAGEEFAQFRESCLDFVVVRRIDDMPFLKTLVSLADQFHRDKFDDQSLAFCDDLVTLIPRDANAYDLRSTVRQNRGDLAGAIRDLERAAACYTEPYEEEFAEDRLELANRIRAGIPIEAAPTKVKKTTRKTSRKRRRR